MKFLMDPMDKNYHPRYPVPHIRIGDRLLGYSGPIKRWAVLEATSYCPDDPMVAHFTAVGLLPECDINPRAWDIFIFQ